MSTGGTAVSVVQEPPSSGSSTSQASGVASEGKDGAIKQAGGGIYTLNQAPKTRLFLFR